MVTHPNLALINQFFEAYATGDRSRIAQILSPSIRWIIPGQHPLSGVKIGIEAVLVYFDQLSKANFKASPIVMGVNDEYVIDCHLNWCLAEGQARFQTMSCLLWKIEQNQIVEVYNFPQDQHHVDSWFTKLYS